VRGCIAARPMLGRLHHRRSDLISDRDRLTIAPMAEGTSDKVLGAALFTAQYGATAAHAPRRLQVERSAKAAISHIGTRRGFLHQIDR
jgi:hypothetical protein